jgi:hypothetical protein
MTLWRETHAAVVNQRQTIGMQSRMYVLAQQLVGMYMHSPLHQTHHQSAHNQGRLPPSSPPPRAHRVREAGLLSHHPLLVGKSESDVWEAGLSTEMSTVQANRKTDVCGCTNSTGGQLMPYDRGCASLVHT